MAFSLVLRICGSGSGTILDRIAISGLEGGRIFMNGISQ
jgi:hypothetical protein